MGIEHRISFDYSGFDATLKYLRCKTSANFCALIESTGIRFAFKHYQWSNMDSSTSSEEFWTREMGKIHDSKEVLENISATRDYLRSQSESRWLPGVLEYLPTGHIFDVTVYLNLGYDNIAYGKDVALNLNYKPFNEDHREVVYYLMHELAHAGYLRYHKMVDLATPKTRRDLASNVMFLTHLEGMGVLTPIRLRSEEGWFLDPDYIALGDPVERKLRVLTFFEKLGNLLREPDREIGSSDLSIYDQFSGRPLRLWYVAGCHMAQRIEEKSGVTVLRELVRKGSIAFFEAYRSIQDPLVIKDPAF